jgi:hypothetical protein
MQAVCLVFLLASLLAPLAWPQASTGTVSGTVRDQTGAVIPGASITLANINTNITSRTTANQVGFYIYPGVLPGPYKITVEASGMQRFEATLTVQVQQSAVVDVAMKVGQTVTEVTVQDVTPILIVDSPTLGHTLERTRIEQLPLGGRVLTNLLQTVPGMEGTRAFGLRQMSFEMSVDGAPMADRYSWNNIAPRQPGLESVQEFRVENGTSSARYARPTSIIVTTRGGTNAIHGSLFETNRNSGYGVARRRQDTFTKAPFLNRNEFGFSLGGPVWIPKLYNGKNRTFWFTSWEWSRQVSSSTLSASLPTSEMRNGDVSALVNSQGNKITIYNPWTTDPTTWQRQQFSYGGKSNVIDPKLISPLANYLLPVTALPTISGINPFSAPNYIGQWSPRNKQYTGTIRIDHKFGEKDSFYGRYSEGDFSNLSQTTSIPSLDIVKVPGNTYAFLNPNWSIALSHVHTFSPTFFNELLVTGTRTKLDNNTGDPTECYDCAMGLPNPFNSNQWPSMGSMGFNGSYAFGSVNGTGFYAFYGIIDDNATKIVGKHELQFGFHFRPDRMNLMPQQQQVAGSFSWGSTGTSLYDPTTSRTNPGALAFTGDQFANLYLGLGRYNNQLVRGMFYGRSREYAWYFQDRWRVTPRLTLNLGMRYDLSPPYYEKYNAVSGFDMSDKSVVLGQPLEKLYAMGITFPSIVNRLSSFGMKFKTWDQAGMPEHQTNTSLDGWGPRLGFAYRAGDGAKSFVVRGGYRISYFHFVMGGWAARMRMNPPMNARFYGPWGDPEQGLYSPDGIGNWWLRNPPQFISGRNTTDLVLPSDAKSMGRGCCGVSYFAPDMPDPRVQDWNLTFEKEIMANTVARAGYFGNHSTRLEQKYNFNDPTPAYVWYQTTHNPLPTGEYSQVALRPLENTYWGYIERWQNTGWGNSNGVQFELERRYSKGIAFQIFYVLDNVLKAGADGYDLTSNINQLNQYMPGAVPTDVDARNRFLNYQRDTSVPKHRVRWNFLVDLPFGKGKPVLGGAGKWMNRLVGGWQIAGMGSLSSSWTQMATGVFPTGVPLETYGYKYPIQDCTSGVCYPGYLWNNGYIPAYRINSVNPATGKPNGYMGVPAEYKPAFQPLWPYPADYLSRSSATDPMYQFYGTNTIWIPLNNGVIQRQSFGGLDPLRQQYYPSTRQWGLDASAFKNVSITESMNVRFTADIFNVFNHPGNPSSVASTGFLSTRNSGYGARTLQLALRLTW